MARLEIAPISVGAREPTKAPPVLSCRDCVCDSSTSQTTSCPNTGCQSGGNATSGQLGLEGGLYLAAGHDKILEQLQVRLHQIPRQCGVGSEGPIQAAELAALDIALSDGAKVRKSLAARLEALRQVQAMWPGTASGVTPMQRPTALRTARAVIVARGSAAAAIRHAASALDCAVLGDLLCAAAFDGGYGGGIAAHLDLKAFAALVLPEALPRLVSEGSDRHVGAALHSLLVLLDRLGPLIAATLPAIAFSATSSEPEFVRHGADVTLEERKRLCEAVAAGVHKMLPVLIMASSKVPSRWAPLARMCVTNIRDLLCIQRISNSELIQGLNLENHPEPASLLTTYSGLQQKNEVTANRVRAGDNYQDSIWEEHLGDEAGRLNLPAASISRKEENSCRLKACPKVSITSPLSSSWACPKPQNLKSDGLGSLGNSSGRHELSKRQNRMQRGRGPVADPMSSVSKG